MIKFVYITCPDVKSAEDIGKVLLEERLAASVNIIKNMKSFYWWEGRIQENEEAILIAKTNKNVVQRLIKRVKELHTYKCPCIASFSIDEVNKEFLDWLNSETVS